MKKTKKQSAIHKRWTWKHWSFSLLLISMFLLVLITIDHQSMVWQIINLVILVFGFIALTVIAFRMLYMYYQQSET